MLAVVRDSCAYATSATLLMWLVNATHKHTQAHPPARHKTTADAKYCRCSRHNTLRFLLFFFFILFALFCFRFPYRSLTHANFFFFYIFRRSLVDEFKTTLRLAMKTVWHWCSHTENTHFFRNKFIIINNIQIQHTQTHTNTTENCVSSSLSISTSSLAFASAARVVCRPCSCANISVTRSNVIIIYYQPRRGIFSNTRMRKYVLYFVVYQSMPGGRHIQYSIYNVCVCWLHAVLT